MSNEEQMSTEEANNEGVEACDEQSGQAQTSADEPNIEPSADEQAGSKLESLQAEIDALKQELADTKDQALRTVADAQNVKRRAEKDIETARKYALEKFAGELLEVVDNLERALDSVNPNDEIIKPLAEGVQLTQKSLVDVLAKFNVEQLDPLGEPFDPQFHQAMSMVENPDVEPNTITLVMQKGYSLAGRLLRPAMVMVAKASTPTIDEKA